MVSEVQRASSSLPSSALVGGGGCEDRFRVWEAMNGLKRGFECLRFGLNSGLNFIGERF